MKVLVTSEDLAAELGIKPYLARKIIKGSLELAKSKGLIVLNTRPITAPYEVVVSYLKRMGIEGRK